MTDNNTANEWPGRTTRDDNPYSSQRVIGTITVSVSLVALLAGEFTIAHIPMMVGGLLYWRTGSVLLGLSPWIAQILVGVVLRLAFEMGML